MVCAFSNHLHSKSNLYIIVLLWASRLPKVRGSGCHTSTQNLVEFWAAPCLQLLFGSEKPSTHSTRSDLKKTEDREVFQEWTEGVFLATFDHVDHIINMLVKKKTNKNKTVDGVEIRWNSWEIWNHKPDCKKLGDLSGHQLVCLEVLPSTVSWSDCFRRDNSRSWYCWWKNSCSSFSGFTHPRWCWISFINSIAYFLCLDWWWPNSQWELCHVDVFRSRGFSSQNAGVEFAGPPTNPLTEWFKLHPFHGVEGPPFPADFCWGECRTIAGSKLDNFSATRLLHWQCHALPPQKEKKNTMPDKIGGGGCS